MPLIDREAPDFGDLVKREFEPLYTREVVELTGAAGDAFLLGAVVCDNGSGGAQKFDPAKEPVGVLIKDHAIPAGETSVKATILARGPVVLDGQFLVFLDATTDTQKATAKARLKALGLVTR